MLLFIYSDCSCSENWELVSFAGEEQIWDSDDKDAFNLDGYLSEGPFFSVSVSASMIYSVKSFNLIFPSLNSTFTIF